MSIALHISAAYIATSKDYHASTGMITLRNYKVQGDLSPYERQANLELDTHQLRIEKLKTISTSCDSKLHNTDFYDHIQNHSSNFIKRNHVHTMSNSTYIYLHKTNIHTVIFMARYANPWPFYKLSKATNCRRLPRRTLPHFSQSQCLFPLKLLPVYTI